MPLSQEIRVRVQSLSIQSSPVRVGVGSENFYKVYKCSAFPSQVEWSLDSDLSGRLACYSPVAAHRCQLLEHLKHLGLTINVQKIKLCPMQNITFLGMDMDSQLMEERLSQELIQSLVSALTSFKPGRVVILECFQRLLGHMAAAAAVVCQLGLLHMRPLQL